MLLEMRFSSHTGRFAATLLLVAAGFATRASEPVCSRIVALGDLHAHNPGFERILVDAGILEDGTGAWKDDGNCLVQLGDIVDRGDSSRAILDRLMQLRQDHPERVFVVMGNHEAMNMVGDLRYVFPGEFAEFAADEDPASRKQGQKWFASMPAADGLRGKARREEFEKRYPPGWFARRDAFALTGTYGAWILTLPTVRKVGGTLFVHAGLTEGDAGRDLDDWNEQIIAELVAHLVARNGLIEAGVLHPLDSFEAQAQSAQRFARTVEAARDRAAAEGDDFETPEEFEAVTRYLETLGATFLRQDGPMWDRSLARESDADHSAAVDAILESAGVERIVVGHTPSRDGRIRARFDGRVFLIDTGASPHYGGRNSALEIVGDSVRAIYDDGTVTLVEPAAVVPAAGF